MSPISKAFFFRFSWHRIENAFQYPSNGVVVIKSHNQLFFDVVIDFRTEAQHVFLAFADLALTKISKQSQMRVTEPVYRRPKRRKELFSFSTSLTRLTSTKIKVSFFILRFEYILRG